MPTKSPIEEWLKGNTAYIGTPTVPSQTVNLAPYDYGVPHQVTQPVYTYGPSSAPATKPKTTLSAASPVASTWLQSQQGAATTGAGATSATTDWDKLLQEVYQGIQGYQDPYLGQLETLTQRWLDPGYRAYSPEQMQNWYEQGKQQLQGDVFREWDEGYGRTMAARGLTGSGVGGLEQGKILGQKGGALADLWGGLQQFGEQATRADVERATTLLPMMSQLRNLPMEQKMQLLNLLQAERSGERSQQAAQQSASAAGWGAAAAAAIPKILSWLGI